MPCESRKKSVYFEVSKKIVVLIEICVCPDSQCTKKSQQYKWFSDVHLLKLLEKLKDVCLVRVLSANNSSEQGAQDVNEIISGPSSYFHMKYTFKKRGLKQFVVMQTSTKKKKKPLNDRSTYSGGGHTEFHLFPERLKVFVSLAPLKFGTVIKEKISVSKGVPGSKISKQEVKTAIKEKSKYFGKDKDGALTLSAVKKQANLRSIIQKMKGSCTDSDKDVTRNDKQEETNLALASCSTVNNTCKYDDQVKDSRCSSAVNDDQVKDSRCSSAVNDDQVKDSRCSSAVNDDQVKDSRCSSAVNDDQVKDSRCSSAVNDDQVKDSRCSSAVNDDQVKDSRCSSAVNDDQVKDSRCSSAVNDMECTRKRSRLDAGFNDSTCTGSDTGMDEQHPREYDCDQSDFVTKKSLNRKKRIKHADKQVIGKNPTEFPRGERKVNHVQTKQNEIVHTSTLSEAESNCTVTAKEANSSGTEETGNLKELNTPAFMDLSKNEKCSKKKENGQIVVEDKIEERRQYESITIDDTAPSFDDVKKISDLGNKHINFLVQKLEKKLKAIFMGKEYCRRHEDYKRGGRSKGDLAFQVRFGLYSEEQQEAIMKELMSIFCLRHNKYIDYLTKVLLPETFIRIYIELFGGNHDEVEQILMGNEKKKETSQTDGSSTE